jgi:large subunit ribosomal protein L21
MDFAVIKTGGKQYIVREGDVLTVEKLPVDTGTFTFDHVLLLADGEQSTVGRPLVAGAAVTATILEEGKGTKKMVFRYKSKTRYKKKKGHRQPYTKVRIDSINRS